MIRSPRTVPGERTQPVVTCDLFFTLLAAAGLFPAVDQPADGVNLLPLVRDDQAKLDRELLYWHYPHYYETTTPVSAVRSSDWKLLEYFEDSRRELFNLRDDPQELLDLAASQPQKLADLSQRLANWRSEVGAKLPQPNPAYRGK